MNKMIRKIKWYLCLIVLMAAANTSVKGQILTYSESFTSGGTATTQCNVWETYRASLLAYAYTSVSITAGASSLTITCTNPTIVADIALCLRTGISRTWTDGSNTWNVGLCGSGGSPTVNGWELSVNNGNCACSGGYCVRPCIGNLNWGGQGTTCSAPSQTMTVVFSAGPPCPVTTGLTVNTVYSMSATFSWTGPSQTNGYEYIVTTTATPPNGLTVPGVTTTSTASGSVTGLLPSTSYFVHVRNKCDSPSKSVWETAAFTTLPPCVVQPNFLVPYLDTNTATITWQSSTTALDFRYVVDTSKTFPTANTPTSTTSTNSFTITQLTPGTVYYVFVMARCIGGDSSGWVLDSFYVPYPCRAPEVMFSDLNSQRVVAYWAKPTASYEYELINSSSIISNPTSGIKLPNTSYLLPYLNGGTKYYIYARSYCDDRDIKSVSPWSSTSYTTWALGVNEVKTMAEGLNVYPNPVTNDMEVTIGGAIRTNGTVTILDMGGKTLKVVGVSGNRIKVDVKELPAGVYTVQYADEAGRQQMKFTKK